LEISKIIEELDAEIARLTQVRNLLAGGNGDNVPSLVVARKSRKKRKPLSAEARERIAAAQRKRWAKQKKAAK
jgi:hypothetical protein